MNMAENWKGEDKMDEKKRIGLFIKHKRQLLDMTQEELAQKVGYKARASVNKIERGSAELPTNKLRIFAEVLQCDIADLIPKNQFTVSPEEKEILEKKLKSWVEEMIYLFEKNQKLK